MFREAAPVPPRHWYEWLPYSLGFRYYLCLFCLRRRLGWLRIILPIGS